MDPHLDVAQLWGKSAGLDAPYPVLAHMLDTAAIAAELLEACPRAVRDLVLEPFVDAADPAAAAAAFAGAHDLGKVSPSFQALDPAAGATALEALGADPQACRYHPHAHITQLTLPEALGALGFELSGSRVSGALGVACALGGHHGLFHKVEVNEEAPEARQLLGGRWPEAGGAAWAAVRERVTTELLATLGVQPFRLAGSAASLMVFAGLVVVADWLASQESFIVGVHDGRVRGGWDDHYLRSRAAAPAVLDDAGLRPLVHRDVPFRDVFGFDPNRVQADISEHLRANPGPGFLAVTVPMGAGKTETALEAARLMGSDRGVFFALPTMATADAMFGRLLESVPAMFEGVVDVSLRHSHAGLHEGFLGLPSDTAQLADGETAAVASRWLRGRGRALLAPVAAGTVDQVLAAALPSKHGFLRWFALAGKTIVIDEAHSLDSFMQRLLECVLRWAGRLGIPVVVLSATMPQAALGRLAAAWASGAGVAFEPVEVPYPGWVHVSAAGCHVAEVAASPRRLELERLDVRGWSDDTELASALASALEPVGQRGCGLVVANTVADAQRIHRLLSGWASHHDVELVCLHSRMRMRDRRRLTESIVERLGRGTSDRPERLVVVATQVVEQSVDIDADVVVSALAPIAPLLQRAGRGHRHADRDRSGLPERLRSWRLVVLRPTDGAELAVPKAWSYVYPTPYLRRTDVLLGQLHSLEVPGDVSALVEGVYGEPADTEEDPDVADMLLRQWGERRVGASSAIPTPDDVASLSQLTDRRDDGVLATRLGVDSMQVLVVEDRDGELLLDGAPLPAVTSPEAVRRVLDATVPLRPTRDLLEVAAASESLRPPAWSDHALLRDVVIAPAGPDGTVAAGAHRFVIDAEIGWVKA